MPPQQDCFVRSRSTGDEVGHLQRDSANSAAATGTFLREERTIHGVDLEDLGVARAVGHGCACRQVNDRQSRIRSAHRSQHGTHGLPFGANALPAGKSAENHHATLCSCIADPQAPGYPLSDPLPVVRSAATL